jgi:homoserine kinase
MADSCRVRVPGSTANLGPGFDAFAAAVSLHLEVEVTRTGTFAIATDLPIATDRRNLVARGFAALMEPDEFRFEIRSEIPLAGGLGTSAAAYVAGLVAANYLSGGGADLLALGTELEGHPDNIAASLLGGLVVVADGAATRLDMPSSLEAVLVVPKESLRTREAREALPANVPLSDAVFNVGHAALLIAGLIRGDLDLVARGLADRLHQPARAHLYPRSMELVATAQELGALGATISGAGPTVVLWTRAGETESVVHGLCRWTGDWADVVVAPFEPLGSVAGEL